MKFSHWIVQIQYINVYKKQLDHRTQVWREMEIEPKNSDTYINWLIKSCVNNKFESTTETGTRDLSTLWTRIQASVQWQWQWPSTLCDLQLQAARQMKWMGAWSVRAIVAWYKCSFITRAVEPFFSFVATWVTKRNVEYLRMYSVLYWPETFKQETNKQQDIRLSVCASVPQ